MNDDEILRRLAEIEGAQVLGDGAAKSLGYRYDVGGDEWNPLTNDDQAMALMKKYKLTLVWWEGETVNEKYRNKWCVETTSDVGFYGEGVHESLNHAICLAVIAAQEEA